MTENKQSIDELKYMQQFYEQQYRLLSDSITAGSNELRELSAVQKALEDSGLMENRALFTYMGSGFYIGSRAISSSTFIVSVGGGYLAEMPADYAKEYIARQIERKSAELNSVIGSRKRIEGSLLDVLHKIDYSGMK